jgi:hypothetical protein
MPCLSVLALTPDGEQNIVIDLESGRRVDRDVQATVLPRCSRDDQAYPCLLGRRLLFDDDPRVIRSGDWALVEGTKFYDFDNLMFMVDTKNGQVVASYLDRPLWPLYSDQFVRLGGFGGPGGPQELRFAILGWRDDDQPSAGIPDWVLRIWDGSNMQEQELPSTLGEHPFMFSTGSELGFLDLGMFHVGVLDVLFLHLATGSVRSLRYDPDPERDLDLKLREETLSLSM